MRNSALFDSAVEMVPVADIVVGERRRKKYGSIAALSKSIELHGLIHPITIDTDKNLIAGGRRLRAIEALGWKAIPARVVAADDETRRAVELDENVIRLDLDSYEQSRQRLAEIQAAEKRIAEAEERERQKNNIGNDCQKATRGRPRKGTTSKAAVEKETGVPRASRRLVERHVAVADEFPFMQRSNWRQAHVLAAAKALDSLPAAERGRAAHLVDQQVSPPKAVEALENLTALPPSKRAHLYAKSEDKDEMARMEALAEALKQPPLPDPTWLEVQAIIDRLKHAIKTSRAPEPIPNMKEALANLLVAEATFRHIHQTKGEAA